jgi:hypothetical protein
MRITARVIVSSAALIAVAAIAAQDSVRIEWKPEIGRVSKYKVEVTANIDVGAGTPMDMRFGMVQSTKVTKIADGKITSETSVSDLSLVVGGNDMSQMMGDRKVTTTSVHKPNGEVVDTKSDSEEMSNPRLEASYMFIYPNKDLKVGETWSNSIKGDSAKGTVDAEATYKLEGIEALGEVKAYKVSYVYKEKKADNPLSTTAVVWLSPDTGDLIKGEYKMKNVEFQPGMPPTDATAKVTKISQ